MEHVGGGVEELEKNGFQLNEEMRNKQISKKFDGIQNNSKEVEEK